MKTKDEVFGLTKSYFVRAEVESREHPNYFHSDGGGEYGSKEFQSYLEPKPSRENKCIHTTRECIRKNTITLYVTKRFQKL